MSIPPRNEGPFYRVDNRRNAVATVPHDQSAAQPEPVAQEDQHQHQNRAGPSISEVERARQSLRTQQTEREHGPT